MTNLRLNRYRDRPVTYQAGMKRVHITYTDWKGTGDIFNNEFPPHHYGKLNRFVHKEKALIVTEPPPSDPPYRELPLPRFNPEIKQNFYAAGYYRDDAYSKSKYWISKNNAHCVSWDVDALYSDGVMMPILALNNEQDNIECGCVLDKITEANLVAWDIVHLTSAIGKKAFVFIAKLNNNSLKLYVLEPETSSNPIYQRDLSMPSVAYFNYVNVGFKTDSKTLVYWYTENDSIEQGIYKLVFNSDYTSQTLTKLGDSRFPIYHEVSTFFRDTDVEPSQIDGSHDSTLVNGGFYLLDVFQDKDSFTLIYQVVTAFLWHEDYTYRRDGLGVQTSVINGEHNEDYEFHVYKIDWGTDSIVDTGKIALTHTVKQIYSTNDINLGGEWQYNQSRSSNELDIDAKLLYANHQQELYIYRTNIETSVSTFSGNESTPKQVDADINVRLFIEHNNIVIQVDVINTTITTSTVTVDPLVKPWNGYANAESEYEYEPFYLPTARRAAFDGTLVICCLDMKWSDIGSSNDVRGPPRTLIYNIKTKEMQLLDYRVDNDPELQNSIFPVSVTSLPTA